LMSYGFVDTSKIAAIGYCFGATGAMNLAIAGHGGVYNTPSGLKGVVAYHAGGTGLLSATAYSPASRPQMLLHQGRADPQLPWATVQKMEEEMEAAGAKFEVTWYGNAVGHGYTHWGATDYNGIADYRSWDATMEFLKDLFQSNTAGSTKPQQCTAANPITPVTSRGTSSAMLGIKVVLGVAGIAMASS